MLVMMNSSVIPERGVLGPPPGDVDKLESVVLGYELPITGDVNLTEIFWIISIQHFHGQELLEMGDGGQG